MPDSALPSVRSTSFNEYHRFIEEQHEQNPINILESRPKFSADVIDFCRKNTPETVAKFITRAGDQLINERNAHNTVLGANQALRNAHEKLQRSRRAQKALAFSSMIIIGGLLWGSLDYVMTYRRPPANSY